MKKLLILGVLVLSLCVGCSNEEKKDANKQEQTVQKVETQDNSVNSGNTDKQSQQNEQNKTDEKNNETQQNDSNSDQADMQTFLIYSSDDNAEYLVTSEYQSADEISVALWNGLKEVGAINADAEILNMNMQGGVLYLDVNKAFGDKLRSQGTSGERMMLGSVVNTFLNAYNCQEMMITEEGGTLQSGHAIYDYALGEF